MNKKSHIPGTSIYLRYENTEHENRSDKIQFAMADDDHSGILNPGHYSLIVAAETGRQLRGPAST